MDIRTCPCRAELDSLLKDPGKNTTGVSWILKNYDWKINLGLYLMGPAQKGTAYTTLLEKNLASTNSECSYFYLPVEGQAVHWTLNATQGGFWVPNDNPSIDFLSQYKWQEADR